MKIGITLDVLLKHCSLENGIEKLSKLGFDSIDFPLITYSIKDRPDGDLHRIMYSDHWEEFARHVRNILGKNGIEAYQTHALWGLYTDMSNYIPPEEQYFRQIKAASIIGSRELVFHPIPPTFKINSIEQRNQVIKYNIRWFKELVPCAEEYGVNLTLENTFTHKENKPRDGLFPFVDGETMNMLADGIGSKNVSFCLDTGHAYVEHGESMTNMVHELGCRLKTLHVHDNFGLSEPCLSSDLHMFPGYGTANLEEVCVELGKIGFDGVFSLEPSHRNMPLKRLEIVLENAVKMAQYYGDIIDAHR